MLIKALPELNIINEIILKKLFNHKVNKYINKDHLSIKIVFDIYEHYYNNVDLLGFEVN